LILGLGIDVVEIDRIRSALERFGDRFLERVLTEGERRAAGGDTVRFLAARFAAKEAASKALGTGLRGGVTLKSLEVVDRASGKPEIVFHNQAKARLIAMGCAGAHLSLTHGRDVAAAVVVLEGAP
jgi:holo-[acyl-carrier protein] synthase